MKHQWTLDELIDSWTIQPNEWELCQRQRTEPNKLGFALLLKCFQIQARFPSQQTDVPQAAIEFVARQLKLSSAHFMSYSWQGRTIKRHRTIIRTFLGFREGNVADAEVVITWLCQEWLPHEPHQEALLSAIYQYYRNHRIEPPTKGRMTRIMNSAIRQYGDQFCETLMNRLSLSTKEQLDALVAIAEDKAPKAHSIFAKIKVDAGTISLKSMLTELEKLNHIQQLALPDDLFVDVPNSVLKQYRQRVAIEAPREVRRHPDAVRYTLLAAFCWLRRQEIIDSLIDLLLGIVKRIHANAEKVILRQVLKEIKKVYGKGKLLYKIAKVTTKQPKGVVSDVIYPVASETLLNRVVEEYETSDSYEVKIQKKARGSYARHYRRMVPLLLNRLKFQSNNEYHQPLIQALTLITQYVDSDKQYYADDEAVPLAQVVSEEWWDEVVSVTKRGKQRINRIGYEVCAFQKLREALRCREVWVQHAARYRNPAEDVPQDFEEKRPTYYEDLKQPLDAQTFINQLRQTMVDALTQFNDEFSKNEHVTILPRKKRKIKLSPLTPQPKAPHIPFLKQALQQRWPMTDLLDMLKETDLRVNFSKQFKTVSTREELDQPTWQKRLLLCLYALGTNTGFSRVGHDETARSLQHIHKRYMTKDNLRAAISEVVNAIFRIRQPQIWGEATTACASDSKKFAAWDQNLLTEWHIRYRGPGIMVYWHIDKKAACIHSQVKSVSSSEVAAMIEGVLHHCTDMQVEKNYVDSHGQSEVAFAFCHLLGFRLLPRLKPISRQKLARPYPAKAGEFENLKAIMNKPIRWELIKQQYDEMVKFATALRLGTAEAESILRRFTRHGIQHPTYKALVELGKVAKTIFLCEYLHSEPLRREIQEGLNVVENWNSANSFIYFGRSGEVATNNRDAQEISILAMHLLQISLVYVNTLMIQQVLAEPDWENRLEMEDLRALTPLIYAHVNPYGRFHLDLDERLPLDD
ncbi:MAG: Tn3 family transposase [Chloroflexi bacterium]|nr:Tn3 family transposase [Chloroflexota bacterium]